MALAPCTVTDILRLNPKPQYWSSNEVRMWLEAINLETYVPTFEAAGIQGADLIAMDADALKKRLGVASLGHRSQLVQHIAVLSARANQTFKREDSIKAATAKRRELIDSMYPDRALRLQKAMQEEKVIEARAKYWNPDDRTALLEKELGPSNIEPSKRLPTKARPASSTQRPPDPHYFIPAENLMGAPKARPVSSTFRQNDPPAPVDSQLPRYGSAAVMRRPITSVRPQQARLPQKVRAQASTQRANEVTVDSNEEEEGEEEILETPLKKMARLTDEIKKLEAEANYEALIKAWVQYGACVRIEHSDTHPLLVRTHFSMATTYLRQKLVLQALQHFKAAEEINACNDVDRDPDAASFRCRIWEGMGICETRLRHFASAHVLLDKAKAACRKRRSGAGEEGGEEGGEEEEEELESGAASVLVALSELHSAEGQYEAAVDCLERAWELKEEELGPDHPQIGKLFSAMAAVKQKLLRVKTDLLADADATLQSALRVKAQIDEHSDGLLLRGAKEESGLERLVRDIGQMQERTQQLNKESRYLKGEVLDLLHRGYKVALKNWGETHSETRKLLSMCHTLGRRYQEEEREALNQHVPQHVATASGGGGEAASASWFKNKGIDLREWGLGSHASSLPAPPATAAAGGTDLGIDAIVSSLKNS